MYGFFSLAVHRASKTHVLRIALWNYSSAASLVRSARSRRLWPGTPHVRLPRSNVTLYLDFTSSSRPFERHSGPSERRWQCEKYRPTVDHARAKANRCARRSVAAGRRPTGRRRADDQSRQSRRQAARSTCRQVRFCRVFQRARSEHPVRRRVGRERHDFHGVNGKQQFFAVPVHRDPQHDQTTERVVVAVIAAGFLARPAGRADSDEQKYRIQRLRRVRNVEKREQTVPVHEITHGLFKQHWPMEFCLL